MNKKFVIAELPSVRRDCLAAVLYQENRAQEFFLFQKEQGQLLGNIYVGKVEKVEENLSAAFVRIAPGQNVYLPLFGLSRAVFKTRKKTSSLKAGDELLVQIEKEAIKSKLPRATVHLHFPGRYLVLTSGDTAVNFSRRLEISEKEKIRAALPGMERNYGVIVRTNAREASPEELAAEEAELSGILHRVCSLGISRPCCTCLWKPLPPWIQEFNRISLRDLDSMVTDDPEIFESFREYLESRGLTGGTELRLYSDPLLPLYKLYSLEALLDSLKKEKVWLKSGGFLVIQQTEAFVAVDVNTGRFTGKKHPEDTFFLINREASAEIARQIRLRQLSGVILIDFINMREESRKKQLLEELRRLTADDPVKTSVVDMTQLEIVEMTRTKERKSLAEQLALFAADISQTSGDPKPAGRGGRN